MLYASVVLDIPTRAIESPYVYVIPPELEDAAVVGATVLVSFSHRAAVGYVVEVSDALPEGLDASRVLPVEQVLAASAFDLAGAQTAAWMSREYACTLADAIRPFLAPGQNARVRRNETDGSWELVSEHMGPIDDRWVALLPEASAYVPRRTAVRQRAVLEALQRGPMRLAELAAMVPGAPATVRALQKRGMLAVEHRRLVRGDHETSLSSAVATRPEQLTEGQRRALAAIEDARRSACGDVVLVDGVTGSGKTEVYLRAIERTLSDGRGALVLVPEIALTAQTVGRFRSRFGERVAVLHSRLSAGERFDQWDLVRLGTARVVVGARSALFAPLHDVGLIVIDEEHEGSYKQDSAPRYHARDVAAHLACLRGAALVLGSATPSLESLGRCRAGTWQGASWTRVVMDERPAGAVLPSVEVVDMAAEFKDGGRSIFSGKLVQALREVVERREKAVLLHNRRGFANFLMCRECGCVPECPHCSTSLTYHERTHELACHSCGSSWPMRAWPDPHTACPNCGSRYMAAFGVGTQRVEDELGMLLSQMDVPEGQEVEVIRMDADTTRGKGAHQKLLERFDAASCAVLVGTQMIAKGLDFPDVTLVGVINADTTLKLPDFRASERTYELLEQVSGRAGRGARPGRVIVQTYWASHPAIMAAAHHDRSVFLDAELAEREEWRYPPYVRLANVCVWGKSADAVRDACDRIAREIRQRADELDGWEVVGPSSCVKERVKDRTRRHVLVKAPPEAQMGVTLDASVRAARVPRGVSVAVDVDAHDLM